MRKTAVDQLTQAVGIAKGSFYKFYASKELLFFAVHLLFSALIRRGWELLVSWIYVFTLVLVIAVGIEFGQKLSDTGSMELADALFGVLGFLVLFAVFCLLRALFTRTGRK